MSAKWFLKWLILRERREVRRSRADLDAFARAWRFRSDVQ